MDASRLDEARRALSRTWMERIRASQPAVVRFVLATGVVSVTVRLLSQRGVRQREREAREQRIKELEFKLVRRFFIYCNVFV